jgi:phage-related protein
VPPAGVVEFYEEEDRCPVREFLDGLELRRRAKLLALITLLEEHGPTLPFPYSSQIRGKLRELRTRFGDEHYRILYFGTSGRRFVLLHAFVKRTEKVPEGDVTLADERMRRYTAKSEKHRRERKQ